MKCFVIIILMYIVFQILYVEYPIDAPLKKIFINMIQKCFDNLTIIIDACLEK
jgi:hypothetical protein